MGKLVNFVHNFVDIDAITISQLLVVTISASIKQDFIFLIFFWIKHVIAFLTEPDTNKSRTVIMSVVPRF